jgi:hypothetical protein
LIGELVIWSFLISETRRRIRAKTGKRNLGEAGEEGSEDEVKK